MNHEKSGIINNTMSISIDITTENGYKIQTIKVDPEVKLSDS